MGNADFGSTVSVIGDYIFSQAKGADENAPKYLLYDGHGSTRQLVSNTGATVLEGYSYDAYGVMLGGNPGSPSNQFCRSDHEMLKSSPILWYYRKCGVQEHRL